MPASSSKPDEPAPATATTRRRVWVAVRVRKPSSSAGGERAPRASAPAPDLLEEVLRLRRRQLSLRRLRELQRRCLRRLLQLSYAEEARALCSAHGAARASSEDGDGLADMMARLTTSASPPGGDRTSGAANVAAASATATATPADRLGEMLEKMVVSDEDNQD
ncbi:hypothetical protein ACP70R_001363 [Stipagrostis hirtigluma subsp. patula]